MTVTSMHVTMLLYPGLTQLDLTGPFEVFARYPELEIDLVWKDLAPVKDGSGLHLLPTKTFGTVPQTDILFVPGGPGQVELMEDAETLSFLRRKAEEASYITSVCTGSLILAAAGLLQGYRATCHWVSLSQLAILGAIPVQERVVLDRDRITGAGVTSGIDFALSLTARLFGEDRAQKVQLSMEYDPQPPFRGGSVQRPRLSTSTPLQALQQVSKSGASLLPNERRNV
jgi:cyclohexyl-isocyanide hydratase